MGEKFSFRFECLCCLHKYFMYIEFYYLCYDYYYYYYYKLNRL